MIRETAKPTTCIGYGCGTVDPELAGRQKGPPVDITDVILRQHDEQRRMFAMLEEWPRDDHEGLAAVWKRLEILLETHAEAEEPLLLPRACCASARAAPTPSPSTRRSRTRSRTTTTSARRCARSGAAAPGPTRGGRPSSTPTSTTATTWARRSARTSPTSASGRASSLRHEIAVQFLRYEAVRWAEGITPKDKDPERYVAAKKTTKASATAKKAARDAKKAAKTAPARAARSKKASAGASEE